MLGAPEVGKTHLTNQFMSSSDVGTFNQLTGKLNRAVRNVLLRGSLSFIALTLFPSHVSLWQGLSVF